MRPQGAGRPERDAFAVRIAAYVVPALLVHCINVPRQGALLPEGDAGALGARVVPALLAASSAPNRCASSGCPSRIY